MKRLMTILLTVILVCSMSVPAFAAQEEKEIDVIVKYVTTVEGAYVAKLKNGAVSINADGVSVSVTGAPSNAKTFVVIPMTDEAFRWIDGCVDGDAKAAYDVHFEDANGNRIGANGASVSVAVSGSELIVSSVNTSGIGKNLSSTTSGGSVSFTTDGSHYYVIYEKDGGNQPGPGSDTVTVPVRGDDNEIHADVTIDGDTVELHELDFDEIDHIIGDHVNTGIVEIDLTNLDEKITKIELPMASIKHIVEAAEEAHNDTEALQIDFPHGSVKLDDKTMRAVVEQAECNEVMLVLESVGESRLNKTQKNAVSDWNIYGGYEAYLLCVKGNKRISDFEGGVATLSMPFEIPNGLKAEKFAVWYVADDGKTEKLDTRYENEHLVWDVGHFSDFIIVYEGDETPTTDPTEPNGNFPWWIIPIIVVVLGGGGFAIYWFVIKKKNDETEENKE